MAKIAVIFVLFALCSVAMSARVTREEPIAFQPFFDSLKTLAESAQKFIQDPGTQAQLKTIQDRTTELFKKGGDEFNARATEIQGDLSELAKKSEGSFKELVEAAKKSFEDSTKAKKN